MVLRAGLIGLGMMGRNHARVMSSTDQVTLVGIADPIGDPAGNIDHSLLVESVPELIEIGIEHMQGQIPHPRLFYQKYGVHPYYPYK